MIIPTKCSQCGSPNPIQSYPLNGTDYMLTAYNSLTNEVDPTKGIKVKVYICKECGIMTFTA